MNTDSKRAAVNALKGAAPLPSAQRQAPDPVGRIGGRQKGIVRSIMEATDGLRGQIQRLIELSEGKHGAKPDVQLKATLALIERVYGRAVEITANVDATGAVSEAIAALSSEQLVEMSRTISAVQPTRADQLRGAA